MNAINPAEFGKRRRKENHDFVIIFGILFFDL